MGRFETWVVVGGATREDFRAFGLVPGGSGGDPGWTLATVPRDRPLERLDVEDWAERASVRWGGALGAYVFDSDYAILVTAEAGQVSSMIVIDPQLWEGWEGGVGDPDAFARWTHRCPRTLTPDQITQLLERKWEIAEDGVNELIVRMGLPSIWEPD